MGVGYCRNGREPAPRRWTDPEREEPDLTREPARALTRAPTAGSSRSLSTARAVLRVFALLLEHPSGVRADEVAAELGKSVSTAYYLLTSLCEEGFAVHESKGLYRPARGLEELTGAVAELTPEHPLHDGLAGTVDQLFLRTRKRSYLGAVRPGRIEIIAFRGRQGVPCMPGLGSEIRDSAHALAMGKVVLSLLGSQWPGAVRGQRTEDVHVADGHQSPGAGRRAAPGP